MNIPTNIVAYEVNTGGNCMVTIIKCPDWDYILATTDESVAIYKNEDDFWNDEGEDSLVLTWIELYPVNQFSEVDNDS